MGFVNVRAVWRALSRAKCENSWKGPDQHPSISVESFLNKFKHQRLLTWFSVFSSLLLLMSPKLLQKIRAETNFGIFQRVCFTHKQTVKETKSFIQSQDELFICGLKNFLISPLKASTKQSQKSTGRNCWTNFKFEKGYILVLTFLSSTSFSLHEDPLMLVASFDI